MSIFIHDKCGMNHGRPMGKKETCEWPKQSKNQSKNQSKGGKK